MFFIFKHWSRFNFLPCYYDFQDGVFSINKIIDEEILSSVFIEGESLGIKKENLSTTFLHAQFLQIVKYSDDESLCDRFEFD